MKQSNRVEFIDAGVDWITVTAREKTKVEGLRSLAYSLIDCQLGEGFFGRPWFQSGYVGVACGHVQFGDRPDGCILRLGGYMAKNYWMKLVELSDNITRIDLQVTIRTEEGAPNVVHKHYKQIQRNRRLFKRAPRLSRICDDDGGYTVYTGRRCSNVMGRIYDKFSESKIARFERCVRYEVQFSGKRARWVAMATLQSSYGFAEVARAVLEFFSERGAVVRSLLEAVSSAVFIKTSHPHDGPTDITKKLEWLLHSVRPSVRHLVSLGLAEKVFGVLGIFEQLAIPLPSSA